MLWNPRAFLMPTFPMLLDTSSKDKRGSPNQHRSSDFNPLTRTWVLTRHSYLLFSFLRWTDSWSQFPPLPLSHGRGPQRQSDMYDGMSLSMSSSSSSSVRLNGGRAPVSMSSAFTQKLSFKILHFSHLSFDSGTGNKWLTHLRSLTFFCAGESMEGVVQKYSLERDGGNL